MKRIILLMSVLLLGSIVKITAEEPDGISARIRPALVTIKALNEKNQVISSGSGFAVSPDGLLITCWHVLEGAARVRVTRENGAYWQAVRIITSDPVNDFALIKVPGKKLPVVSLGDSDSVARGDRVLAFGLGKHVSHGVVSKVDMDRYGGKSFYLSARSQPGWSGGPVLDMEGRVIGIVTAKTMTGDVTIANPINALKGKLSSALKVNRVNRMKPAVPISFSQGKRILGRLGIVYSDSAQIFASNKLKSLLFCRPLKGTLLVLTIDDGDWYGVLMSDGRTGWIGKQDATILDYDVVQHPSAEPLNASDINISSEPPGRSTYTSSMR